MLKLEKLFDRFSDRIGDISGVLTIIMVLNVFYDVIARYFFKSSSIAMQEMEWHLFSLVFLFGISFTLKEEGHVRVDIIYDNLSPKKKAVINMVGTFFFLIPFSLLIIRGSIPFVMEAYNTGEISGDPGGLPYRWIIKAMVPVSFVLLVISSVGYLIKNYNIFKGRHETAEEVTK